MKKMNEAFFKFNKPLKDYKSVWLSFATVFLIALAVIGQQQIVKEEYLYEPGGRIGAQCFDGTKSRATGSGACSHHGGVAQWITSEIRHREVANSFLSRNYKKLQLVSLFGLLGILLRVGIAYTEWNEANNPKFISNKKVKRSNGYYYPHKRKR